MMKGMSLFKSLNSLWPLWIVKNPRQLSCLQGPDTGWLLPRVQGKKAEKVETRSKKMSHTHVWELLAQSAHGNTSKCGLITVLGAGAIQTTTSHLGMWSVGSGERRQNYFPFLSRKERRKTIHILSLLRLERLSAGTITHKKLMSTWKCDRGTRRWRNWNFYVIWFQFLNLKLMELSYFLC